MADENIPKYAHLLLPRAEGELERKQRPGFGGISPKSFAKHGSQISTQVDSVLQQFQSRTPIRPHGIDPKLLLRVRLERAGSVSDDDWRKNGLILLSEDREGVTILFASKPELIDFRKHLHAYERGPRPGKKSFTNLEILPEEIKFPKSLEDKIKYDAGKKRLIFIGTMADKEKCELQRLSSSAQYRKAVEALFVNSQKPPSAPFFDAILEVREYGLEDRKGKFLRETTIDITKEYPLDMELWHPGDIHIVRKTLNQLETYILKQGGKVVDRYVGTSVCLARVIARGDVINQLLQLEPVSKLDLPPKPSLTVAEVSQLTLEDFSHIAKPSTDAPCICIIDSGIASGHPLLSPAVGETICVPSSLGSSIDEHGHGTQVAGIALYNDISECIRNRDFNPSAKILSAKVTEVENTPLGRQMKFPDEKLISNQIREAIEYFHR